ncbi:hsp70 family protein [Aeoliella mucimassa]|uniref:Chaperone protein DnaK n=1 Tax=Aeoliella mucimassa TaxID=2527972 RepID=A0A518AJS6_9BACT|nr:hsp70 family protein [Aeoliella mucimassa]QDU54983.1 Chaperone protein DnaK [Aeoliella mucimassa]
MDQPTSHDQDDQQRPSRYVVGIDLGTTNSAMAYVDTHEQPWQVRTLAVPQLVAPFEVASRDTLPSFHYQGTAAEVEAGGLQVPWVESDSANWAVGVLARDEGTAKPGRLIASAKSWLCHAGVDRTSELLPWQGDADVERLSPVDVTSRYLAHLREAWQQAFPKFPLAEQDVVVTLPASFDEVARELTVAAAKRAELPRVLLIEEPQAAFYAWVDRHAESWQQLVTAGQKILVCDVGGGTSDFTLIRVRGREDSGDVEFHRVAVGEHLILGGDNLDLALARHVEQRLAGDGKLPPEQWEVLVRTARRAKETLLGDNPPESLTINLPAAGSKLIGGGLQVEVTRSEVEQLLVDGFLPRTELGERPTRRQSGFQDFGLPYAADAGITRYLAAFLEAHRTTGDDEPTTEHDPARPDLVLFNGGFFASPMLRERLIEVVSSWFDDGSQWQPVVLDHDRLDLAVARGAAYYGMVRRGEGVGITANLARSYYIGLAGEKPQAVCLAPGSASAGQDFELPSTFQLTLAEPVEFPLYVSSTRLVDPPGTIVPVDQAELKPLPPIRTVLDAGRKRDPQTVDVHLHAHLTEIGALELSCRAVDSNASWRLQFDVRSTTQTDMAAHESAAEGEGIVDEQLVESCRAAIASVFDKPAELKPSKLMPKLSDVLEAPRHEWPTSVLRRMWELLMEVEPGRRQSQQHESRWLNLVGYSLRPGYGYAVDDWRVTETWRTVRNRLAFPASQAESLILWRRIAGGLTAGQQLTIAEPLLAGIRALARRFSGGKAGNTTAAFDPAQSPEVWRLVGSLELLPVPIKTEIGSIVVDLLPKRKLEKVKHAMLWTVGRLGQRVPVHGPLNTLVSAARAGKWLDAVLELAADDAMTPLVVMQLARMTGDRHRDLEQSKREQAANWLEQRNAAAHLVELVRHGGTLDHEEQSQVFGEALPSGLRLR